MTEAETHNANAFEAFKKSPQYKTHKLFAIISANPEGRTNVFQSPLFSPGQIADKLQKISDQIIASIRNIPKPN